MAWGAIFACQGVGFYFLNEHDRVEVYVFGALAIIFGTLFLADAVRLPLKPSQSVGNLSRLTLVLSITIPALALVEMYNPKENLAHIALLTDCALVLISSVLPANPRPPHCP